MKILKAGTRVKTIIGEIEAMVVGVCITIETVEYKIRYFANGDEKISWVYRFEIEISTKKQQAGFGAKQTKTDIEEVILLGN